MERSLGTCGSPDCPELNTKESIGRGIEPARIRFTADASRMTF